MSALAAFRRAVVNPMASAFQRVSRPNRADTGLYGGKGINFGNNVSHSNRRTRRRWNPNTQTKRLWSDCFDTMIRLRVTTYVLKTIDKKGGLDNYLAEMDDKDIDSELGTKLKEMVLEQRKRLMLGLEPLPPPWQSDIVWQERFDKRVAQYREDQKWDQ